MMRFRINRIIRKVLKNPPKGQEIKEFAFKKLTKDMLFILNVTRSAELYAHDIGLLDSDKENTFGTYLISEFRKAEERERERERFRAESERYAKFNAKYFGEYLRSIGVGLSDDTILRTAQGRVSFGSRELELYKQYLGTTYASKAKDEYHAEKGTDV